MQATAVLHWFQRQEGCDVAGAADPPAMNTIARGFPQLKFVDIEGHLQTPANERYARPKLEADLVGSGFDHRFDIGDTLSQKSEIGKFDPAGHRLGTQVFVIF